MKGDGSWADLEKKNEEDADREADGAHRDPERVPLKSAADRRSNQNLTRRTAGHTEHLCRANQRGRARRREARRCGAGRDGAGAPARGTHVVRTQERDHHAAHERSHGEVHGDCARHFRGELEAAAGRQGAAECCRREEGILTTMTPVCFT